MIYTKTNIAQYLHFQIIKNKSLYFCKNQYCIIFALLKNQIINIMTYI